MCTLNTKQLNWEDVKKKKNRRSTLQAKDMSMHSLPFTQALTAITDAAKEGRGVVFSQLPNELRSPGGPQCVNMVHLKNP